MTSPFSGNLLITGGGGFLGRGILRHIERERIASHVTVYSRDEAKHYALRARFPNVRTVLGDVVDEERLAAVMAGHDTVIHAAALKHIPEAERDVSEAIRVNVDGSRAVAQAALRTGVRQVVGISTDKVCSPVNTYGATKMLMERAFQEAQRLSPYTRFTCVRYGNVISSTGSVVPLFLDQLARHGEVSITSPEMTRFWIAIEDAVRLIERALSDAPTRRGHTYVARCPAMKIMDVAAAVWALSPQYDHHPVHTRIIGVRPGEKLHETLIDTAEAPYAIQDGAYVMLPPALSMAGEAASIVMPYQSSHPDYWLTPPEMLRLIEDAREV